MAEFLQSPFAIVALVLLIFAVAILGLVGSLVGTNRQLRGLVDGLEAERRKIAQIQMYLSQRSRQGAQTRRPRPQEPRGAAAPQAGVVTETSQTGRSAVVDPQRGQAYGAPAYEEQAYQGSVAARTGAGARTQGAYGAEQVSPAREAYRPEAASTFDSQPAEQPRTRREPAYRSPAYQAAQAEAERRRQTSQAARASIEADRADAATRERMRQQAAQARAARAEDAQAASMSQDQLYGGAAQPARGVTQSAQNVAQPARSVAQSVQGVAQPAASGFIPATARTAQRSPRTAGAYQSAVAQAGSPGRAEAAEKPAKSRRARSKEMEIPRAPDQTHGVPLSEWPTDDAVLGQGGSTAAQRARQQAAARQAAQVRQAAQARRQGATGEAPVVQSPSQSGRLTPRAGRQPMTRQRAQTSVPQGDPIPVQVEAASSVGLLRRKRGTSGHRG